MTLLQKRALYSLVIGLVLTAVLIIAIVIKGDVTAFHEELSLRLVMYIVLIGVPLAYIILVEMLLRKPNKVDERDELIIERSYKAQWIAAVFTVTAWTIVLTEVFWGRGQVPVDYLNLIFVSTLIIGTLAQSLGILLGYRRLDRNG